MKRYFVFVMMIKRNEASGITRPVIENIREFKTSSNARMFMDAIRFGPDGLSTAVQYAELGPDGWELL